MTDSKPAGDSSKQPKSDGSGELLANVARTGDRLATLQTLRDRLASDLDETHEPREVAALALRFTDVLAQLDSMPTNRQVSAADEIAERRTARRRARAKNSARAARPG